MESFLWFLGGMAAATSIIVAFLLPRRHVQAAPEAPEQQPQQPHSGLRPEISAISDGIAMTLEARGRTPGNRTFSGWVGQGERPAIWVRAGQTVVPLPGTIGTITRPRTFTRPTRPQITAFPAEGEPPSSVSSAETRGRRER